MNAEPNRAANPAGPAASEVQRFPVLDGYWQGLQQGAAADLEQWLRTHPEGQDARPELRVLAALHNACRMLGEDSRLEPTTNDGPAEAATVAVRQLLEPGTLLGEYRIDRLLGCGGMSEVYLAEHQLLAQNVAVKVLPAHLADAPEAVKRFRWEIKVTRKSCIPFVPFVLSCNCQPWRRSERCNGAAFSASASSRR
ncbi:MAG: hypothetical protein L0Z62_43840 [Gemmataceae bacterium]|nr:hypothetical protein [Gemmataceae bacterium]